MNKYFLFLCVFMFGCASTNRETSSVRMTCENTFTNIQSNPDAKCGPDQSGHVDGAILFCNCR